MEKPTKAVKPVAVSQYPRHYDGREIMGYAWRDGRYRYIEWEDTSFRKGGSAGKLIDTELYDYETDPLETKNLVDDPAYAEALADMRREALAYKYIHRSEAKDFELPAYIDVADPASAIDPAKGLRWRKPDGLIPYAKRPKGKLMLHVFQPDGWKAGDRRSAVVAFHGGGWVSGSPRAFYPQAQYLASRGMVVICPEYRIRKVHGSYPIDSVRDAMQAMQFARANAARLGIDPERIAAIGGSAGGHLALATATLSGFESKEAGLAGVSPRPNALALFNPVLDTGPKGYGHRLAQPDPTAISPIDHIHSEQPPTLIFNGDRDTISSVERCLAYAEKTIALGNHCELVLYPDQSHSFFNRSKSPQNFADTLTRAEVFLDELGYFK